MPHASFIQKPSWEERELRVSFEFFPPKTEKMEEALWHSIRRLEPLKPHFISVTYGAGGSTRERTHATIARILKETTLAPAAHLTCVGATRDEVDAVAENGLGCGLQRQAPAGQVHQRAAAEIHATGYAVLSRQFRQIVCGDLGGKSTDVIVAGMDFEEH